MTFTNWFGLIGSYVLLTIPFLLLWHFLGVRWSFVPLKVWTVEIKPKIRSYLNRYAERYRKRYSWYEKSIFSIPSDIIGMRDVLIDNEIDQDKVLRWSLKIYLLLIVPYTIWQVYNVLVKFQ